MNEYYNKHYIRINASGNIIEGWSDGPHNHRTPTEDDICINDKGGYQFRLIIDGEQTEENPPLFDGMSMIPLYKWTGSEVVRRSKEEIEADRAKVEAERQREEAIRVANLPETKIAALEDAMCETDAAYEERFTSIEDALCELSAESEE